MKPSKEQIPAKALEVVMKVAEIYDVPVHDIMSKFRNGNMIIARHVAMHRLYTMQPKGKYKYAGVVKIARWFDRDHSSVVNAIRKVNDNIRIYDDYAATYNTLVRATSNMSFAKPVLLTLEERISRLPKDDIAAIISFVEKIEKQYGNTHDAGKTGGSSQREVDSPSDNKNHSDVQFKGEKVG